jgi:hypothetical protein
MKTKDSTIKTTDSKSWPVGPTGTKIPPPGQGIMGCTLR